MRERLDANEVIKKNRHAEKDNEILNSNLNLCNITMKYCILCNLSSNK